MAPNGILPSDILLKKLRLHSLLEDDDLEVVRKLPYQAQELADGQDFVRQGDRATTSAVVLRGVLARYHTLASGDRQYLSIHIAGDWPDAQGLFLERMDHSVCAMGDAAVCVIPHEELVRLFRVRPTIGFAIWRETLIDAAIFRAAITNNSARRPLARLAHFFCEIYARTRSIGLTANGDCPLPFSQTQLGELLGMSLISVNRHLQVLRERHACEFRSGRLTVLDFGKLSATGGFDALYLHRVVQPLR